MTRSPSTTPACWACPMTTGRSTALSRRSSWRTCGMPCRTETGRPNLAEVVDVTELPTLKGRDIGSSRWVTITQDQINTFATLTGDEQWIHVDEERAKSGPY